MRTNHNQEKSTFHHCHGRNHNRWLGSFIILMALFVLGGTLGIIPPRFFDFTSGFCYGLAIVGIIASLRRHVISGFGFIALAVGIFFSRYNEFFHAQTIGYVWFAILAGLGLVLIFRRKGFGCSHIPHYHNASEFDTANVENEDGFVTIRSDFSGTKHDVAYKEFKGANIESRFSGVVLDLRLAIIPEGITYIDVFLKFSGLELYLPSTIEVRSELNAFAGGIEDKRLKSIPPEQGKAIVIRGDARFGGITIKS